MPTPLPLRARTVPPAPIERNEPAAAARAFVDWLNEHGLAGRTWTVDDVWWLALEDFGPALSVEMPARDTFLREVKRVPGVKVTHDVRMRGTRLLNADGTRKSKTTTYHFAAPVPAATRSPKPAQAGRSGPVAKFAMAA